MDNLIGETPQAVAYALLKLVANVEHKALGTNYVDHETKLADRAWILDTYAECLKAAFDRR